MDVLQCTGADRQTADFNLSPGRYALRSTSFRPSQKNLAQRERDPPGKGLCAMLALLEEHGSCDQRTGVFSKQAESTVC